MLPLLILTLKLKSLRTLFDTYENYILAKFEPICMIQNVKKLELLGKTQVLKIIFDKEVDAFLQDVFVAATIV